MSFFEVYSMGIPVFTPNLEYAVSLDLQGTGMSLRQGAEEILHGRAQPPYPPSPADKSYESVKFWLGLSDFLSFPHVQRFSDEVDAIRLLCNADYDAISSLMENENRHRTNQVVSFWASFFNASS